MKVIGLKESNELVVETITFQGRSFQEVPIFSINHICNSQPQCRLRSGYFNSVRDDLFKI